MFNKMTEEETFDYTNALNIVKQQQTQRKNAIDKGIIVKQEYSQKINNMKETGKKMFLLFTMAGCPSCSIIKYITKYSDNFLMAVSNMEFLSIDINDTKTDIIEKYQIYSYPQYLIIDKDEKIIAKKSGCDAFNPEQDLVRWIKTFDVEI